MKVEEQQSAEVDLNQVVTTNPSRTSSDEHNTLKYHLLGPSLTKAGQDAVDQKKVNYFFSCRIEANALVRYQK